MSSNSLRLIAARIEDKGPGLKERTEQEIHSSQGVGHIQKRLVSYL